MWLAKLRLTHDCLQSNRCKEFGVSLQSIVLTNHTPKNGILTASMHILSGPAENKKQFLADIQRDPRVVGVEIKKDVFFLLDKDRHKPVAFFTPQLFFVKPVLSNEKGIEYWEVGSWDERELKTFVHTIQKHVQILEAKVFKAPLDTVYFPKVFPGLTELQKRAFELALKNGYYKIPKQVGMRHLAEIMGVSLSNYQKHLKKAESYLLSDLAPLLK